MFKSRKKIISKHKRNHVFIDRSIGGTKKLEGNSNITNKRLTVPPGFLCLGIKSEALQKRKDQKKINIEKRVIDEDLHELFADDISKTYIKPRRSTRIFTKTKEFQNNNENKCSTVAQQKNLFEYEYSSKCHHNKKKLTPKNTSKSLFKEINKRSSINKNLILDTTPVSIAISTKKLQDFRISSFCKGLYEEIHIDLKQNRTIPQCKLKIAEKIQNINKILFGKSVPSVDMADEEKRKSDMEKDPNARVKNFDYIPKCQWIFKTPPRQKVMLPKVDECTIKPAIICTTKKQSSLYELNPDIRVNLNHNNGKNIEVDPQYLRHLASVDNDMDLTRGISCSKSLRDQIYGNNTNIDNLDFPNQMEYSTAKFSYNSPCLNVPETQFMSVISRPVKSARRYVRANNAFKRKIAELESTPTIIANQINGHFEGDFTFMEEDGEVKIMNIQGPTNENNFDFELKKDLFKVCGEENIFNFSNEDKMFDFRELNRNDC